MIREVLEIITVTGLKLGQTSAPQEAASHPSSHRRVSMGYGRSLPVGSGGLACCDSRGCKESETTDMCSYKELTHWKRL